MNISEDVHLPVKAEEVFPEALIFELWDSDERFMQFDKGRDGHGCV